MRTSIDEINLALITTSYKRAIDNEGSIFYMLGEEENPIGSILVADDYVIYSNETWGVSIKITDGYCNDTSIEYDEDKPVAIRGTGFMIPLVGISHAPIVKDSEESPF